VSADRELLTKVGELMARDPDTMMRSFRRLDRDFDGKVPHSFSHVRLD
jgi:hypothetical protein